MVGKRKGKTSLISSTRWFMVEYGLVRTVINIIHSQKSIMKIQRAMKRLNRSIAPPPPPPPPGEGWWETD
jgi:hypothetical protein